MRRPFGLIASAAVAPRAGASSSLGGIAFHSPCFVVERSSISLLAQNCRLRASVSLQQRRRDGDATANSDEQRLLKFISPYEQIDAFAEYQISKIFSSSSGGEAATKFVPLSLAGRWTQQSQNQQSSSSATILLAPPEECQVIADAYEEYLKSPSSDNSSNSNSQSKTSQSNNQQQEQLSTALPLPISPTNSPTAIKLLAQTYSSTPLSKSVLLSLNSLFINRDSGLFDNLPWSTWSIDPNLYERDAANNVMEKKYTMGKRVAYQRFMGKDWEGRSLSLGNLVNRVRYLLERDDGSDGGGEILSDDGMAIENLSEEDMMMTLSTRLLQLEIKEAKMGVAECEQNLAISKNQLTNVNVDDGNNTTDDEIEATRQLERARARLQVAESSLEELTNAMESASSDDDNENSLLPFAFPDNGSTQSKKTQSQLLIAILDKLAEQENPPPYRGAIGYPAKLDTKKEMFEDSILPYSSPYEMLLDIIDEQLNSEVMGCVLEPTSLLEGNLVLGGALLLKRKGVQKSTTLSEEIVSYTDDDDDLGNEGVLPRSMYVVECFSDEAIGMAMAGKAPIFVEEEIYNRAGSVPIALDVEKATMVKSENGGEEDNCVGDMKTLSFANRVPPILPMDESLFTSQLEGEKVTSEQESNSVRIPLTTSPQLFDGPDQILQSSSASTSRSSVFSTFNPVKSLDEYDELADDAKVRLLLKLDSFSRALPRPRAVRTSKMNTNSDYDDGGSPPSLLDDILLPLVDESVRRQYLIRDAERRKDFMEAEALLAEVSPRQAALESAQNAREEGFDDEAYRLEEEAELYKALRADVTQDEGAYNRYLDRDEWYERETQARIKRLKEREEEKRYK